MRSLKYAIVSAAIAASTQAPAETPQQRHVTTTADLIELCGVSAADPIYEAAMGFCLGYIDAAMDYHAALTDGPNTIPLPVRKLA